MKVVVVFLAVFASIICYVFGDLHIVCKSNAQCTTKNYTAQLLSTDNYMDCEKSKCAAWQCVVDNVLYRGYGCYDYDHICIHKENTDSKFSKYYVYITCDGPICNVEALEEATKEHDIDRSQLKDDNKCNVRKANPGGRKSELNFYGGTTNGINALSKNDVLKIAVGMFLFGWYFVACI